MERVILKTSSFFILAYIIGTIPSGYIVGRLVTHTDIRTQGSGNIGFANVMRTAGVFWGIVVLFMDAGKAFPVVFFFSRFFDAQSLLKLLFGCTVVAGNIFNPFLRFKGGKGVGTGLGACAAMSPFALLFALFSFGLTLVLSRYISLSSLTASAVFLIANALFFRQRAVDIYTLVFASLLFAAVFVRHISNIRRLAQGEENKIGKRR